MKEINTRIAVPYAHILNVKQGRKPKFSRIWVQQGTVHCRRWTFQVYVLYTS